MQCGLRLRAQAQASVCGHPGPATKSVLCSTVCPFRGSLSGLCKAEKSSPPRWSPFQPGLGMVGSTFCGRRPVRCAAPPYPLPTCRPESPKTVRTSRHPGPHTFRQCGCPQRDLVPHCAPHLPCSLAQDKSCVCEIKQTHGNGTQKYIHS